MVEVSGLVMARKFPTGEGDEHDKGDDDDDVDRDRADIGGDGDRVDIDLNLDRAEVLGRRISRDLYLYSNFAGDRRAMV